MFQDTETLHDVRPDNRFYNYTYRCSSQSWSPFYFSLQRSCRLVSSIYMLQYNLTSRVELSFIADYSTCQGRSLRWRLVTVTNTTIVAVVSHAELSCRSLQSILLVRGDHCVGDW